MLPSTDMPQAADVRRQAGWTIGIVLVVALVAVTTRLPTASAERAGLSANVRSGGIDSRQRDQKGSRIRRSRAVGLVRAPAEAVANVVLDYGSYRHFMPHFVASRVLAQRGHQARVYMEVSALSGLARLWVETQIAMTQPSADTRVVAARMLRGNLRGFEAEWHVTPISPTHTLVAFELCADPDFSIPFADGLVSDYNEKEARSTVLALRDYLSRKRPVR
jgi:ribosome-associated toxin RatA of RatAB toxin-antitoxin module